MKEKTNKVMTNQQFLRLMPLLLHTHKLLLEIFIFYVIKNHTLNMHKRKSQQTSAAN